MRETLYGRNPIHECLRAGRREVFKLLLAQGVQEKETLADIVALAGERRNASGQVPLTVGDDTAVQAARRVTRRRQRRIDRVPRSTTRGDMSGPS